MLPFERRYRRCVECQALKRRTLKVKGRILCVACRREKVGWNRRGKA